jgi:cbb3-type cytochrome oxidase subunit 3
VSRMPSFCYVWWMYWKRNQIQWARL